MDSVLAGFAGLLYGTVDDCRSSKGCVLAVIVESGLSCLGVR